MAKEQPIKIGGKIIQVLPKAQFRVELDNGRVIIARMNGKMRENRVSIILGDKVDVEVTLYDLTQGRIVRRHT